MPPRRKRAAAPARRSARFAEQDAANEKAQEHANRTYEIGDRVEARWDGRPEWFPGKVIAMNDDKTYDILYDDGDDELNVKPSLMKREGEPDPPSVDEKVKRRPRPKSPRPGTPTSDGEKPKRKKEPYVIPKQYDVLMEALETEEENRRWLIKQKRDALANDESGIVLPPKNFGMHPRRYSSREGNVVNFPKTDHMPEVLYGDQRPPAIPDKKCCITGKVARYKCPRTGLPYHDLAAFKELRRRNGLSDGPLRTNTVKDYELVDADDRINREKRHPAELPQRPPVEEDLADAWTRLGV